MSILANFPHKCTIRRRVRVKDELGGSKDSFLNEQTNVLCWEQHASQREILEFEKRGMLVTSKIYFTTDPNVSERHQIMVTERNGTTVSSPIPLDVVTEALPDATAGKAVAFKIFCTDNSGEDD